ncbi:MAG: hypothetical protein PHC85_03245 [Candidatus Pacebacteria bacterium]|nr:hypothetical protein [Candidatus Paceibacterota bacterium]
MIFSKTAKIAILFFVFASPMFASAESKATIYMFGSDQCPHCQAEKAFLKDLKTELGDKIEIKEFEISDPENFEFLQKVGTELKIDATRIPITIIGNNYFSGFSDANTTGELIRNLVDECLSAQCPDIVAPLIVKEVPENPDNPQQTPDASASQQIPDKIKIPLLGEKNIKNFSLPLLTLAIAAIDGFNPCAMWVLIFLIGLLLGINDRKRMWLLGITFIATSAAVYFLFLSAWLNLFIFLGFIFWVRLAVGIAAVASGFYYLKRYFTEKTEVCQVSESEKEQKIFERLKKIAQKKYLPAALLGIILLAAAVNIVELVCSVGLPAIYTQVLSLSELPSWQYYGYLLLYVFVFMMDDIIIFLIAMITLKSVKLTKKYNRLSALIGGVAMAIIGLLLIFRPEWLMLG